MNDITMNESDKKMVVAVLLCFFIGIIGVHRFYVGKVGTGILMIVTLGALGIWALVDLIMIITGSFKDKENRKLQRG
jgi:TM2 domain-containing membrane protein YozV